MDNVGEKAKKDWGMAFDASSALLVGWSALCQCAKRAHRRGAEDNESELSAAWEEWLSKLNSYHKRSAESALKPQLPLAMGLQQVIKYSLLDCKLRRKSKSQSS